MPQFNYIGYGDVTTPKPDDYGLIRDDTEADNADKMKRLPLRDALMHTLGYKDASVASLSFSGSAALADTDPAIQIVNSGSASSTLNLPSVTNDSHPFAIFNGSGSAGGNITMNDDLSTVIEPGFSELFSPGTSSYFKIGVPAGREPYFASPTDLTISGGAITVTQGRHTLTPESGTVDTLDTINGGVDGKIVMFTVKTNGHFIVFGSGGNIIAAGEDIPTLSYNKSALLIYDSSTSKWCEITELRKLATSALWQAKGQMAVGTGAYAAQALNVGANGEIIVANSGETTGLKWIQRKWNISIPLGNGSEVIATGIVPGISVRIPFNCKLTGVDLEADQSGSLVVDIWMDSFANYPPTDADSITSSTPPTLSSAIKSSDTTLTSWTTDLVEGYRLYFNVDSAATCTWATLQLYGYSTAIS